MSLSGFLVSRQKNRPLIGRTDRSANQRPVFLAGNYLNSFPDSGLRKIIFNTISVTLLY